MVSSQIHLVQKSWRLLRHLPPDVVADAFYSKLFLDHPELRRLFPKRMDEQYKKLFDTLSFVVARLEKPEQFLHEIGELAKRHEGYGVKPGHYALVGDALLWTLKRGLGEDWTEETGEAWRACYGVVSEGMQGSDTLIVPNWRHKFYAPL